jgi:PAS domain-containing protein
VVPTPTIATRSVTDPVTDTDTDTDVSYRNRAACAILDTWPAGA